MELSRRQFLHHVGLGAAALGATGAQSWAAEAAATARRRPNIILIMADDLGPGELSCYGSTAIPTPHLDRLAATGTAFRTCWATPVCMPSRVLLMTGRYGFRTGCYNMGDRPGGPAARQPALDFIETEVTFGTILQQAGYATALAGKWQLTAPSAERIPAAGFDEHCIWRIPHTPGFGGLQVGPDGKPGKAGSRYWHPSLERNGEPLRTEPNDFGPDFFTDFLIDFARRHQERPFFLYYPMALPHGPLGPTPDRPLGHGEASLLKANVEYIDTLVGRIVAALDEMGLRDDTVILFTGDNGTEHRGKNTPTEAGVRVPLIVSAPGRFPALGMHDALTEFTDIFATVVDLAGAPLPPRREYDGHSLVGVLDGHRESVRDWVFSYMGQFRLLRTRDWLLENECVDYGGDFYYCGNRRDGVGYVNRTDATDADTRRARERFAAILHNLPAPPLPPDERVRFLEYLERYNAPDFKLDRAYPSGRQPQRP